MTDPTQNHDAPLLSQWAALIFLIALLAAAGGAWLGYLQTHSLPSALMVGAVTFAGAIYLCKSNIR